MDGKLPYAAARIVLAICLSLAVGAVVGYQWGRAPQPEADPAEADAISEGNELARQVFALRSLVPARPDDGTPADALRRFYRWIATATSRHQMIAGGVPISKASGVSLPYLAAIIGADDAATPAKRSFICGAVFIADDWLVTAAHCVEDGPTLAPVPDDRYVVLSDTTKLSDTGVISEISRIYLHEDYFDAGLYDYDIALIRIRTATTRSVIGLANASEEMAWRTAGTGATAAGWGHTPTGGFQDEFLVAQLPAVDQKTCAAAVKKPYILTASMACAGTVTSAGITGKGICYGDSGGPLIVKDSGTPALVGISSLWGCGTTYSIFADIPKATDWINACMAGTKCTLTPPPLPSVWEHIP